MANYKISIEDQVAEAAAIDRVTIQQQVGAARAAYDEMEAARLAQDAIADTE